MPDNKYMQLEFWSPTFADAGYWIPVGFKLEGHIPEQFLVDMQQKFEYGNNDYLAVRRSEAYKKLNGSNMGTCIACRIAYKTS